MLFFSCSKDSLYPASRSGATMELSPHPNDIWVLSLHMSVPWKFSIPIVKDAFLAEVVSQEDAFLAEVVARYTELVFPKATPQADQPMFEMVRL